MVIKSHLENKLFEYLMQASLYVKAALISFIMAKATYLLVVVALFLNNTVAWVSLATYGLLVFSTIVFCFMEVARVNKEKDEVRFNTRSV